MLAEKPWWSPNVTCPGTGGRERALPGALCAVLSRILQGV